MVPAAFIVPSGDGRSAAFDRSSKLDLFGWRFDSLNPVAGMSIALSEFWSRLVRSGITDAAGCKRLAGAFTEAHDGTPPSEAGPLAKFMVSTDELTKFQARALLAEPPGEICVGSWLIRDEKSRRPLSQWAQVTNTRDKTPGVLFRAGAEHLAGGRDQWLDAHQSISSATLQNLQIEPAAGSTLVFSPLPRGACLLDFVEKRGVMAPIDVCDLGISIAEALQAMHQRPLVHGSVRLDRVWMTDRGQAILLRDPSQPPATPWQENAFGWLDELDRAEDYAAPEFSDRSHPCDPATDIYSLGCLLFRLAAGRPPYSGDSVDDCIAAHLSQTPPELAEAIAKGEAGDPLYRVVAFAMAKNPGSRFASAQQLAAALQAARPLIEQQAAAGPSTKPSAEKRSKPTASTAGPAETKPAPEKKSAEIPKAARPAKKPTIRKEGVEPKVAATKLEKRKTEKRSAEQKAAEKKPVEKQREDKKPVEKEIVKEQPAQKKSVEKKSVEKKSVEKKPAEKKPVEKKPVEKKPVEKKPVASAAPADTDQGDIAVTSTDQPAPEPPPPIEESPVSAEAPFSLVDQEVRSSQEDSEPATSESAAPSRRRRKKKSTKAPVVLGAMCVAILMLMIMLLVYDPNASAEKKRERPRIPDQIPSVTNRPRPSTGGEVQRPPEPEAVAGYELVSDERLLYVPPYAADTPPAPLELLPPGPAAIVSLRLAAVSESTHGSQLIETLSPELPKLIQTVATRTMVPLELIQRCTATLHPGKEGWPEVTLAIELSDPQPRAELIEKWQVSPARTPSGATIHAGQAVDSPAFYFPDAEGDSVSRFAVGSIARITEVAEVEGGAIPLPRSMQTLWQASSDQADLVVMFTPNFLFADGRAMLQSSAPELVGPLKGALIPGVAAALVMLSVVDDRFYAETRMIPSGGVSEAALLRALEESIGSWPTWADEFIVDSVPDASWRLLASRLPSMMRFVVEQIRFGISDQVVVANAYLPARAVPQVTLAAMLAMNTPPSGVSMVQAEPIPTMTVEEMLERKMSVSFGQESLEFALDSIVTAFQDDLPKGVEMPPVRIIGGDLEMSGITQNQEIRDFSKTDQTLRSVLTDLVVRANPDKSATAPSDPKQALIWVVADDEQNPGQKVILITTRKAADGKYEVPGEFQAAP